MLIIRLKNRGSCKSEQYSSQVDSVEDGSGAVDAGISTKRTGPALFSRVDSIENGNGEEDADISSINSGSTLGVEEVDFATSSQRSL